MLAPVARSAEMVNVEYVHNVLNWRWGIDLPYNSALENPGIAANMKYLLTVVDIANEYLNDEKPQITAMVNMLHWLRRIKSPPTQQSTHIRAQQVYLITIKYRTTGNNTV